MVSQTLVWNWTMKNLRWKIQKVQRYEEQYLLVHLGKILGTETSS